MISFILLAILRMVLVLFNPPTQTLWPLLCGFITKLYKFPTKQKAIQTQRSASRFFDDVPVYFEFFSEYAFFLMLTFVCMTIKIIIQVPWIPVSGLIWWYKFFHNIIHDPGGRSIRQIFKEPVAHPISNIPKLSQEESSWLEHTRKEMAYPDSVDPITYIPKPTQEEPSWLEQTRREMAYPSSVVAFSPRSECILAKRPRKRRNKKYPKQNQALSVRSTYLDISLPSAPFESSIN